MSDRNGSEGPAPKASATDSTESPLLGRNVASAKALLLEFEGQRREYLDNAPKSIAPLYTADEGVRRQPPREYRPNSLLFIRGYPGDDGRRPFLGRIRWQSPDVEITLPSAPQTRLTTLKVNQTYRIRCTVRNRGDRIVPSAKVEIWLGNLGPGRNTTLARHLTEGAVPTVWVNANATAIVEFTYKVKPGDVGQKAFLVRVFSFSPKELPINLVNLDPMQDRHVAEFQVTISP